ncbi:DUF3306 domain-containing protein [Thioalkalivibrio sp. HK1]|uniref:DUF3306 domain-containing protein n=1 Tax=Thioalkalivibrio sp. HK1 TaxID=1469245 RepID=UPI00046F0462|nr:DUF3306 domain-containing protein [Thioalkalivibrio sp. HK1]
MSEKRPENDSTASFQDDSLGDSQAPGPLRRWLQRRRRVQAEDEKRASESVDNAIDRKAESFARAVHPDPNKASGENASLRTRQPLAEGIGDGFENEIEQGIEKEPEEGFEGKIEESTERRIEGETEEKILTDADMPPIETLDEHSDYSGFLSPGVSEELRRRALRKLFLSAAFNVRDGLDDYDDDFTSFEALGDMVTADMKHQMEVEAERAQAAQGEAENAKEIEDDRKDTRATEHPADTEIAPERSPDERKAIPEQPPAGHPATAQSPAQEPLENAPTEGFDTAHLAAESRTAETDDPSKTTDTTPKKDRSESEIAHNQPAARNPAQGSFENEPTEIPADNTATTEASQAPPPHPSPTSRAK